VLEANKMKFDDLSDDERKQALEALNIISGRFKKQTAPKLSVSVNQNSSDKAAAAAERKAEAERLRKLRNQKEIVIDFGELVGRGYPSAVNLNTGATIIASVATPRRTN
jgi:hypothetical protein